ncbi:hypothetical protein B0O99DRAFT_221274 [Bisporella sp. PMI_857]|nr:hypothetical protein B0O99DRAFT_221274 [Bisporella sp. PMI_857]
MSLFFKLGSPVSRETTKSGPSGNKNVTAVPENFAQPGGLQAPESIFTSKFDSKQVSLRVHLVFYFLIFGALPYCRRGINPLVETMVDVFGELPPEWGSKWKQMRSDAVGIPTT